METYEVMWNHRKSYSQMIWNHTKPYEIIWALERILDLFQNHFWLHPRPFLCFWPLGGTGSPNPNNHPSLILHMSFKQLVCMGIMNGNLSTPPAIPSNSLWSQTNTSTLPFQETEPLRSRGNGSYFHFAMSPRPRETSPSPTRISRNVEKNHPPVSLARTPRLWLRIWLRRPGGQWSKASKRRVIAWGDVLPFLVGNRSLVNLVNKRPCSFFVV